MIRKLALIAVAVVNWTLIFRQTYDDKPKEFRHRKAFADVKEARTFYKHRPKPGELFECVNLLTAMPGLCEVKDVELTEVERDAQK